MGLLTHFSGHSRRARAKQRYFDKEKPLQYMRIMKDGHTPERIERFDNTESEIQELLVQVGKNLINNTLHTDKVKQLAERMIGPLVSAGLEGFSIRALTTPCLTSHDDRLDIRDAQTLAFVAFNDTLSRRPLSPPV